MTPEEKQILLIDLCARLPYGFTVHRYSDKRDITFEKNELDEFAHFLEYSEGKEFKPYLRPMSSMTEEERKELSIILGCEFYVDDDFALRPEDDRHGISLELCEAYIDWLNANYFDYRMVPSTGKSMIESGIALEAPEDMYKTE